MYKISVIVPMYNSEEFIRKTLDSLVVQTCDSLEVLIIDDGSTDASAAIADEYAHRYANFRVIHKENGRFATTINRGLDEATGEYIGFVESDDWVDPETYEYLLQVAVEHDLDFVRGDYIVETQGKSKKRDYIREFNIPVGEVTNLKSEPQVATAQMGYWAGIYKRSLIEKYNIRLIPDDNIPMFQDYFFVTRVLMHAERGMFIPKYFHHYNNIPEDQSIKNVKYPHIMNHILSLQSDYLHNNNIKLHPYSKFIFYLFPLAFNVNRFLNCPESTIVITEAHLQLEPLYKPEYLRELPKRVKRDVRVILKGPTLLHKIRNLTQRLFDL